MFNRARFAVPARHSLNRSQQPVSIIMLGLALFRGAENFNRHAGHSLLYLKTIVMPCAFSYVGSYRSQRRKILFSSF